MIKYVIFILLLTISTPSYSCSYDKVIIGDSYAGRVKLYTKYSVIYKDGAGLYWLKNTIKWCKINTIVVIIGSNDLYNLNDNNIKNYVFNLRNSIRENKIKNYIIVGPSCYKNTYLNSSADLLDKEYKRVFKKYISLRNPCKYLDRDGIHLTLYGSKILAKKIDKILDTIPSISP